MQGTVLPPDKHGLYPIDLHYATGDCQGCAAKGACKLPTSERIEVPSDQLPPGIQPGDKVLIDLKPSFRVWLSFSIFIVPLILMLAGALLGSIKGESWAIGAGFAGLLVGVLATWLLNRSLSAQKRIHITRC